MYMVLIDHYDSFTFNVIDWLQSSGSDVTLEHVYCDNICRIRQLMQKPEHPLVFSPGPNSPLDCSLSLELLRSSFGKVPMLGICLGHQLLGVYAGGEVVKATNPFHGSKRHIRPEYPAHGLFEGVALPFYAATYNSLAIKFPTLPLGWTINATCEHGDIQGISSFINPLAPAFGVQFHPESFLSERSETIRGNWLKTIAKFQQSRPYQSPHRG